MDSCISLEIVIYDVCGVRDLLCYNYSPSSCINEGKAVYFIIGAVIKCNVRFMTGTVCIIEVETTPGTLDGKREEEED